MNTRILVTIAAACVVVLAFGLPTAQAAHHLPEELGLTQTQAPAVNVTWGYGYRPGYGYQRYYGYPSYRYHSYPHYYRNYNRPYYYSYPRYHYPYRHYYHRPHRGFSFRFGW